MKQNQIIRLMILMFIIIGVMPMLTVGAYAQERMTFSPASVELLPNDNIEVTVSLSEPIIAATTPAYVTIALQSPDSRVVLNKNQLSWSATDWSQNKTFTLSMSGTDQPRTVFSLASMGISIESNAAYYDGYTPSFTVTAGERGPLLQDSFESTTTRAIQSR